MFDLEIHLSDEPGALAAMGRALGDAGVSVEGGGAWVVNGRGIAHFLVADAEAANEALDAAGISVAVTSEVVVQRLRQDVPGQLGDLCAAMAAADVNIEALYSDHDHQLILRVDDLDAARGVAANWMQAWGDDGGAAPTVS